MAFRFAGFEHCEMQAETFVPGQERNKLPPEHVELANFDVGWVRELNSRAHPAHVTFFVEVPVDVSLERIGDRGHRDIYETREKLERQF